MSRIKTAIVGAGAAGLMAAVFSARNGQSVTVFERNSRAGRKLCITGKGRCNVTNNCDIKTVIENTPTNGRFLYSALSNFSPADTMAFFESCGLLLKTERGGRVFPVSDRASDVADTLLRAAKKEGCTFVHKRVSDIITYNGAVKGLKTGEETWLFDRIIIACGGLSYPLTGSTGDGYAFAKKAGHTIIPPKPSLVPLETVERPYAEADKLLLKNISLTVYDNKRNGKKIYSDFGELQLMKYGVTGAMILSASSHLREMERNRYTLELDLKPALSEEQLDLRLIRELKENKGKPVSEMLHSLLPSGIISTFIDVMKLSGSKNCSEVTREERRKILKSLKAFTLTVKGFRPIEEAVITSGGVSVKEIDPKTMESKLIKGLYFAGEVIDVDAYTGGFNLQCAFSTAVLAALQGSD